MNAGGSERLLNSLRSGVIQNFEIAYELSWKYMKRWLEANISPDIVTGVARRDFYRIARENKLIANLDAWLNFHEKYNKALDIYEEIIAHEVFEGAVEFLVCSKELLQRLECVQMSSRT